jgi:hypothetical protein
MPTEAHPYLYVGCNPINYTDPTGLLTAAETCGVAATLLSTTAGLTAAAAVSAGLITVTAGVAAPAVIGTAAGLGATFGPGCR